MKEQPSEGGVKNQIETIKANVALIRERAEKAKAEKAEYVNKKVKDRETLIAKSAELEELGKEAQSNLDALQPLKDDEVIANDPEFNKQLEAAAELVQGIIDQQKEVNDQLTAIEAHPDVLGKVWDEANEENKKFDAKKEQEKAFEEAKREAQVFANEVADYAEEVENWYKKQDELISQIHDSMKNPKLILDEALKMFNPESKSGYWLSKNINDLIRIVENKSSIDEFDKKLDEIAAHKKQTGFFKGGKERAAVDHIIQKKESVFGPYHIARVAKAKWGDFPPAEGSREKSLAEKYKAFKSKFEGRLGHLRSCYRILEQAVGVVSGSRPGGRFKSTLSAFNGISRQVER